MKSIGLKILAVLFPPLVVRVVAPGMSFYVNLACTAVMYIPGSLHALYVVCATEARARNLRGLAANGPAQGE